MSDAPFPLVVKLEGYLFETKMLSRRFVVLFCLTATVVAHGDHDGEQKNIAGPHEALWYNRLPGDGGTQVCLFSVSFLFTFLTRYHMVGIDSVCLFILSGGFGLLGHLDLWTTAVSSVLG